jgi:hypothetical protein
MDPRLIRLRERKGEKRQSVADDGNSKNENLQQIELRERAPAVHGGCQKTISQRR